MSWFAFTLIQIEGKPHWALQSSRHSPCRLMSQAIPANPRRDLPENRKHRNVKGLALHPSVAYPALRADGWMTAGRKFRGKSGLHERRVPGNARRGQPQGKRHREETAMVSGPNLQGSNPGAAMVMVKRWGKSPPRTWQQGRYGKPHPEQCRIGASRGKVCPHAFGRAETSTGIFQPGGPGWQLDCVGNGAARGMVIHGRKLPGQNPAYRLSAQIQPENGSNPEFQDPAAATDVLRDAEVFRWFVDERAFGSGGTLVEGRNISQGD